MTEQYSGAIKELLQAYYQGRLSMEEYRIQRKVIIDKMDVEHNGFESPNKHPDSEDMRIGFDAP